MTGPRRRLHLGRWVVGGAVWLMIASTIGLEHGHSQLADVGTLIAVTVVALLAISTGLRITGRLALRGARAGWTTLRRARRTRR